MRTGLLSLLLAAAAFGQDADLRELARTIEKGMAADVVRALDVVAKLGARAAPIAKPVVDRLFSPQNGDVEKAALKAVRAIGVAALPKMIGHTTFEPKSAEYLAMFGEAGVPFLVKYIRSDLSIGGGNVARALARIGKPAVAPLRPAIEDGYRYAAEAAGHMGKELATPLLPALRAGAKQARLPSAKDAFAVALVRLGDPGGIELLRARFDPPSQTGRRVFAAMKEIGPKARAFVPQLHACLDAHPVQAAQALWAIEKNASAILPHLARVLTRSSGLGLDFDRRSEREAVMTLIKEMGKAARPISPLLVSLSVREYYGNDADAALIQTGLSRDMAPRMLHWIKTGSTPAKITALHAVGVIGMKEAAPAVLPLLGAEDLELRAAAVRSLKRLGYRKADAVPHLAAALDGADDDLAIAVLGVLAETGDAAAKAVPELRKAYRSLLFRGKTHVLWVWARLGRAAAEAKPEMLFSIQWPDDQLNRYGALAIRKCLAPEDRKEAVPHLLKLVKRGSPRAQQEAGWALVTIDQDKYGPGIAEILAKDLAPSTARLPIARLELLGNCGTKARKHLPLLKKRLGDPRGGVRVAAALAHYKLSINEDEVSLRVLREALRDKDKMVRVQAAYAAGAMGADGRSLLPLVEAIPRKGLDERQRAVIDRALEALRKER